MFEFIKKKVCVFCLFVTLCFVSLTLVDADNSKVTDAEKTETVKWISLFDGKTLDGWSVPKTEVGGKVKVTDGVIVFGRGDLSTGIKYEKKFPTSNYEIMYQAKRVDGYDFFGTLTFPVKDTYCSFVNGGWGGGVIGLSSINGYDASENETTGYYEFKTDQWYQFRIRVSDDRITVWVTPFEEPCEGKEVAVPVKETAEEIGEKNKPHINVALDDEKKLSTRIEVHPYKPLGITSWCTEGHLRDIKYRELTLDEINVIKLEKK